MKLKIKICGMRDPDNIAEVSSLSPDYLGFIFHETSPRDCSREKPEILNSVLPHAQPVMVSVNMPENKLLKIVDEWNFKIVQLHGNETPQYCRKLRDRGLEVWKAISVRPDSSSDNNFLKLARKYEESADMLLFDTASINHGGSGICFDWQLLRHYDGHTPFILSGGISAEHSEEILSLRHPSFMGIDLNSRFETKPAMKDAALLHSFISKLKQ